MDELPPTDVIPLKRKRNPWVLVGEWARRQGLPLHTCCPPRSPRHHRRPGRLAARRLLRHACARRKTPRSVAADRPSPWVCRAPRRAPPLSPPRLPLYLHSCEYTTPLVPSPSAGACATAGVLFGGLLAFKNGKSALAQHFMRARVVVQGVTVAIMIGSGGYLAVESAQQRADYARQLQQQQHEQP